MKKLELKAGELVLLKCEPTRLTGACKCKECDLRNEVCVIAECFPESRKDKKNVLYKVVDYKPDNESGIRASGSLQAKEYAKHVDTDRKEHVEIAFEDGWVNGAFAQGKLERHKAYLWIWKNIGQEQALRFWQDTLKEGGV